MLNGLRWLFAEIRRALSEDMITVFSASASLYIIIASVPFAILLLSLVQFLLPFSETELIFAVKPFLSPKLHFVAEALILELFLRSKSIISISLISALWTASRGVSAISKGVRRVYAIDEPTFFRAILKDSLNTLLLILMLILSLVILVFGSAAGAFLLEKNIVSQRALSFFGAFRAVVFLALLTMLFTFIYRLIAGRAMPFKSHIAGAVFSAVGWVIFSLGYEFYIERFANYSYIYGSLTAVVLLMLWLYFCMIIFLFGAEINRLLQKSILDKQRKEKLK